MIETRQQFQEELAQLEQRTLGCLDLVDAALARAVEAVRQGDAALASLVIADDDRIDGRYLDIHQTILSLLALQAPVAGDLRLVAALLHVIKHVERMGDQCVNVAKLIPADGEPPPADDELLGDVLEMGALAGGLVRLSKQAFAARDAALAHDLVRRDDAVDALNRRCFQRALDVGDDPPRRAWAMRMLLTARAIERIGDNAVDIGEQTAFVVTGLFREFGDGPDVGSADGR